MFLASFNNYQAGATQTNEYIQILPVFAANIMPDLQSPVDGSIHPVIKVDAIKYLLVFRSQVAQTFNASTNILAHQTAIARNPSLTDRPFRIEQLRRLHLCCRLSGKDSCYQGRCITHVYIWISDNG